MVLLKMKYNPVEKNIYINFCCVSPRDDFEINCTHETITAKKLKMKYKNAHTQRKKNYTKQPVKSITSRQKRTTKCTCVITIITTAPSMHYNID